MKYKRPNTLIVEAATELLASSGPNAGDIGSPTVSDDTKGHSVWDEDNETHLYNIKEENNYEGKVYE